MPLVLVDGVPAGASAVELGGQLTLRLRRPLRGETSVSAAGPVQLSLGGTTVTLTLSPGSDDQPGGLTIASLAGSVQDVTIALRDGAGRALPQRGRGMRPNGRRQEETWQFPGVSGEGAYQATVTGYEPLAQPTLPIALSIPLP